MRTFRTLILFAGPALLSAGGCPTQTTDGTSTTTGLTTAQKTAVSDVAEQTAALGSVWGTCSRLATTDLGLNPVAQDGTFGECPSVSLLMPDPQSLTVNLEFGIEGCSGPATGGYTVSGSVNITISRGTQAASVVFDDLALDNQAVTGSVTASLERSDDAVTLTGTCDIATAQVGSAEGSITVEITTAGLITITTADATLSTGSATYDVALANVVLDPLNNGNFWPESGTATFEVPNDGPGPDTLTVVVTFSDQTPVDGTVQVTVEGAGPYTYQIPGVPTT
jgi:hypothetical protein